MEALVFLPLLPVVALLLLHIVLDAVCYPSAIRAFKRHQFPQDIQSAAIECFRKARRADRKTWFADSVAPVIVPLILLFTPRSANQLPRWARLWENNVSINGDSGGTLMEDGTWLDWRDTPEDMWQELYGKPQLSYSDPEYTGDCYYCKGHHPRSFIARYVWLGWRNRASALSVAVGEEVRERPRILAEGEGWRLLQSGALFQWVCEMPEKRIYVRRNVGYKLETVAETETSRAAATAIWWSLRRGKTKAEAL